MSLRVGLILSYLAVVLVAMLVAALIAASSVEQLYLQSQRTNLLAQAQRVATALSNLPETNSAPMQMSIAQAANVLPGINTRIIDEKGGVLVDLPQAATQQAADPASDPAGASVAAPVAPPAPFSLPSADPLTSTSPSLPPAPILYDADARSIVTSEELLQRSEIQAAKAGAADTAIRIVPSSADYGTGTRVLYAAAPVRGADGTIFRIVYISTPLPQVGWGTLPSEARVQILSAIAAVLIIASALGSALAILISRPLQHMAQAANAVAAGDLQQQVAERHGMRELGMLARTFNQMTRSLRRSDQLKSQFIADVSHELRTPLTVIRGAAETLQDGAVDDLDARDGFLTGIVQEVDRLTRMVNDLLLLTRADNHALQIERKPLDLVTLAHTRVQRLHGLADKRQVQLSVSGASSAIILGDENRLTQVFDNLIDNAIRHTFITGQVVIIIQIEGDRVTCAIQDTGSGIPAKHLPHIFDRFYRAESSRDRVSGGAGLGLAITRSIVEAHGGQISAESAEGRGTTIRFVLPQATTN